jgi:hypothetical protein
MSWNFMNCTDMLRVKELVLVVSGIGNAYECSHVILAVLAVLSDYSF